MSIDEMSLGELEAESQALGARADEIRVRRAEIAAIIRTWIVEHNAGVAVQGLSQDVVAEIARQHAAAVGDGVDAVVSQ